MIRACFFFRAKLFVRFRYVPLITVQARILCATANAGHYSAPPDLEMVRSAPLMLPFVIRARYHRSCTLFAVLGFPYVEHGRMLLNLLMDHLFFFVTYS